MANGRRGSKMQKRWSNIGGETPTNFTTDSTAVIANVLGFTEAETVIRMIGEYIIGLTAAAAAQDHCVLGVGIGIFSSDAVTLGGTAVPDPFGEPSYPWLYWASHPMHFPETAVNQAGAPPGSLRRTFDIRSMRKVKPRESLAMIVEYRDGSGAPPITFSPGKTRVLLAQ